MRRSGIVGVALIGFLTVVAVPLEGQRRPFDENRDNFREPSAWIDVNFLVANPVGEFGEVVDDGFGGVVAGSLPIGPGAVRIRADAGFLIYGRERQRVCFSATVGCRVTLDLTTSNSIMFAGVGPEFTVPYGPFRPYVNATAGFSYFTTTSSLSGDLDFDSFADTRNFSDFVGAVRLGGGVRTRVKSGRTPIFLDFGAQYHRNGVAEYLREGDIVDHPDGSITIFPNRSEANLVTYRVGISIGVGGGGDDRDEDRRRRQRRR